VFGVDANGKVKDKDRFHFPANNLFITSIDIQSVRVPSLRGSPRLVLIC
jgi:hypothetical protein